VNDKEQYPRFARTIPDSEGEAIAIVKYLCSEVQTRHLVVPHEQQEYGTTLLSSIVVAASEHCPEMTILPVSIPEPGLATDEDIRTAVTAIKNSGFKHIFFVGDVETFKHLLLLGSEEGIAGNSEYLWTGSWSVGFKLSEEEVEENSKLHKALQGFGSVNVEAGVAGQGDTPYDNFVKAFQSLANPDDMAFINNRQPYPDSFIPPPTFNKVIIGAPFFMYDAIVTFGLAACDVTKEVEYFDGSTFYEGILNTTFEGTTGKVSYIKETGSREPESTVYSMNNFLGSEPVNGTVIFEPTITNIFRSGEWSQPDPNVKFVYSGGGTVAPVSMIEAEVNMNYIGTGLRAAGLLLCAIILALSIGFAFWSKFCS